MKLHSQTLPEVICKQIARPLQETVVEETDPVSTDLLVFTVAGLEKTLWMLQAENS